jgi:hypothetical protein
VEGADPPSLFPRARVMERRLDDWMRRRFAYRVRGGGGFGGGAKKSLYALTAFSASSNLLAGSNGGEVGNVVLGFGLLWLARLNSLTTVSNCVASRSGGAAEGYFFNLSASNGLAFLVRATSMQSSALRTMVASDVGRLHAVLGLRTPTGIRLWVDRVEIGTVVAVVGSYVAPGPTQAHSFGALSNLAAPAVAWDIVSELAFTGTLTDPQIAALFDAVRVLGDVPKTIDGGTVTHRWSLRDQLLGVNASNRKSYGAMGWQKPTYFETAAGGGVRGSVSGFFAQSRLRILGRAAGFPFACGNANALGWYTQHTGTALLVSASNGTLASTPTNYTLLDSDIGRTLILTLVYDQPAGLVRFYLDDVLFATQALSGSFAPYTAGLPTRFGAYGLAASSGNGFATFQCAGGNVIPTQADLHAQMLASESAGKLVALTGTDHLWDFDAAIQAAGGAAVSQIVDSVSGATNDRANLIAGSMDVLPSIETAPLCPTQLTDTITQASADAFARVGSPRVVAIDTSIDGRTTKGVVGLSDTAYLTTSSLGTGGIAGTVTPFWIAGEARIDAQAQGSSNQVLIGRRQESPALGFQLYTASQNTDLRWLVAPGTNVTFTIPASWVGQKKLVIAQWDGTQAHLYADGAEVGTPVTVSFAPFTGPMRFGRHAVDATAGVPADRQSHFGGAGGNFALTLAEVQQMFADYASTGKVVPPAGKGQHLYDFTLDMAANNGELPTQFLDRIGTDHLTKIGPEYTLGTVRGQKLLGSGTTQISGLATLAGGGIGGAAAAITVSMLVAPLAVLSATLEMLASRFITGSTQGWDIRRAGTVGQLGTIYAAFGAGSGNPNTAGYTVQAGDLNTLLHLALTYNGSTLSFYVNGNLIGSVAVTGTYVPPTIAMLVGARSDGFPSVATTTAFVAIGGGAYVASQAELAAQATASIAAGQLVAIPGKTDQRRYNYTQDATALNPLPVRVVDQMGSGDDLFRIGAGLQLAQRTERAWSWETTPIMKASQAPTTSDRRESAAMPEWAGKTSWFIGLVARCRGTTTGRIMSVSLNSGSVALSFNAISGTQVQVNATDAGGVNRTSPTIVTAADSKVRCMLGVLDGPSNLLRGYQNRAQSGSGSACTGFLALSSMAMSLHAFTAGGSPNIDWDILGFVVGYAVPTLAQFQSWEDACLAGEDAFALGDQSAHLYSVKRGLNGTTLTDLLGSYDLAAVNSPIVTDIYARAWSR